MNHKALLTITVCVLFPVLAQNPKQAAQVPKGPWMDKGLPPDRRADMLVEKMTLDEKITLVHGLPGDPRSLGGAGYVAGVPRLGIPELQMTDGRSGVANTGKRGRYATALPSALSAGATWDLKVAYEYGALIGKETRDVGFNVSLGGTSNLIREPRNGRNFECWSEDPILTGKMLGRELKGTQDQKVIGNINRYAVNDQETGRQSYSVVLDKRSLWETDLLAFYLAIKESDVGTVMCAYNRFNGEYCCENSYLLTDVLKKAWQFNGWIMSDWGGTHSTVKSALAGFDQEMPKGAYYGDTLKAAVEKGEVPVSRLNDMVHRILRTEFRLGIFDDPPAAHPVNPFAGAEVAQRVAERAIVLLKNASGQLPLNAARMKSIAVIGSHADAGVLSGGGSDQVDAAGGNAVPPQNPARRGPVWHPSSPLKALRAKAPRIKVEYDPGTDPAAAAKLAAASDVAIVFANQHTSEGRDEPNLSLPDNQDDLIRQVAAANPRTIVVLETGGPVLMPWIDSVSAVLEAWYPGIRGGEAIANILVGDVNPSGRLPLTCPKSEADLPHLTVPGYPQQGPQFEVKYTEGLKAGYKWFDAEDKAPLFPFGFGLSYTSFAYSGLKVASGNGLSVAFSIRNAGRVSGTETAQVYAALPAAGEPPKRLVAWEKVSLAPGQVKNVAIQVEPLYLSVFNPDQDKWELVPGDYKVFVGGSSRNTPLTAATHISAGN